MNDDVKKAATWLGIAGSVIGVLAFFGIANVGDVERVLSGSPETTQPAVTSTESSYASDSTGTSESTYTTESSTEDPGCSAASDTIERYVNLFSTDIGPEAAAGVSDDMASAFDSDAADAEDSEVESALKALAADSRAMSRALPPVDQSDINAFDVASDELTADLDELGDVCGWS